MINVLNINRKHAFILQCAFYKLAYEIIEYKPCPKDEKGQPKLPKGDKPKGVAEKFGDIVYVGEQTSVTDDGIYDEAMHILLLIKLFDELKIYENNQDGFATEYGYFLTRNEAKTLGFGNKSEDFLPKSKQVFDEQK